MHIITENKYNIKGINIFTVNDEGMIVYLIQSLLQEVWGEAEEEKGDDDTMGMIDPVGGNLHHEE